MKTYKYLNADQETVVFFEDGLPKGQIAKARLLAVAADDGEVITIEPHVPPTQAEIDAALQAEIVSLNEQVMEKDKALRALAEIILDEINILRVEAGLVERTRAQLKTAHLTKMETL